MFRRKEVKPPMTFAPRHTSGTERAKAPPFLCTLLVAAAFGVTFGTVFGISKLGSASTRGPQWESATVSKASFETDWSPEIDSFPEKSQQTVSQVTSSTKEAGAKGVSPAEAEPEQLEQVKAKQAKVEGKGSGEGTGISKGSSVGSNGKAAGEAIESVKDVTGPPTVDVDYWKRGPHTKWLKHPSGSHLHAKTSAGWVQVGCRRSAGAVQVGCSWGAREVLGAA